MATAQEIPLLPSQNQTFSITLAGVTYNMAVTWRVATEGGWFLDIYDASDAPQVLGIAMVTGVDLLEQHRSIGFPGQLWVQSDFDPQAVPTFDNLGQASHLYFIAP